MGIFILFCIFRVSYQEHVLWLSQKNNYCCFLKLCWRLIKCCPPHLLSMPQGFRPPRASSCTASTPSCHVRGLAFCSKSGSCLPLPPRKRKGCDLGFTKSQLHHLTAVRQAISLFCASFFPHLVIETDGINPLKLYGLALCLPQRRCLINNDPYSFLESFRASATGRYTAHLRVNTA